MLKAGKYSLPTGQRAYVMAVINLTPDSFYASSRYTCEKAAEAAVEAVRLGADIIDLGAQSTAPGSTQICAEEELERLIVPLRKIRSCVDVPISVDTFYPAVAKAALENSADIVNDVSGSLSFETASLVKEHGAGWIIMHTGGLKSDEAAEYNSGIVNEINSFFSKAVTVAENAGLDKAQLCLDPGIGFGKTRADDLEIIRSFSLLQSHGCAKLAALSRKRVTRLCGDELIGTHAANVACILGGADIIRVHDIEQAAPLTKMISLIKGESSLG